MLIYRVEDKNGLGIYMGSDASYSYAMAESMRHPTPEEDAGLSSRWKKLKDSNIYEQWSFAYGSLEQLKNWIYRMDWREEIDKEGFRAYVYETNNYYVGDTQAIFVKADSKLQYSLSLLEI